MHSHDHFESPSSIATPRLRLRPMREEDAESVVAWRNEPSTAAMFFRPPPTLEEHRQWFAGPRAGRVDYMIVRKDFGRPIGVLNFKDIDDARVVAEAGKLIGDRDSRGKGMAKEAFAAWLGYGFQGLGLQRVVVRTRSDNSANIHLNRRLGFEIEERYQGQAADGNRHEFLLMAIHWQVLRDHPFFQQVTHFDAGEERRVQR